MRVPSSDESKFDCISLLRHQKRCDVIGPPRQRAIGEKNMSKILGIALLLATSAAFATPVMVCPEIDPGSAFAGLTMLAATLAVVRGRRAKKQK
jgi:hypothetical protein